MLVDLAGRGLSITDAHRKTGHSVDAIRANLAKLGLKLPRARGAKNWLDWDLEIQRAINANEYASQTARRLGVSPASVYNALKRKGRSLHKASKPVPWDWAEAFSEAQARDETQTEMARRLNVPRQTVSLAAKRLKVVLRSGKRPIP